MSPNELTSLPSYFDPNASQQSSITQRLYFFASLIIFFKLYGFPKVWATMISFVLLVIAFSVCAISIFKVSSSASIKIGFNPYCKPGFTVVGKATEQVINSSPDFSCLSPKTDEVREAKATKFAEDPELTSET